MSQTKAQLIGDLTQALEFTTTASTPADGLYLKATNQLALATNSVDRITAGTSELVVNESGASVDFRVEGDTNANLLFVDASTDRIGVGTTSPTAALTIVGGNTSGAPVLHLVANANQGDYARMTFYESDGTTSNAYINSDGSNGLKIGANNGPLNLQIGANAALTIDTSRRVGIGTSTITENLTLISNNDTSAVDNGLGIYRSTSDDKVTINCQGGAARFIADGGSGYIPFRFARYNGTTLVEDIHISSSGNIGVGKVSSGNKLEIEGQGNTKVVIDGRTDAANGSDAILELWSKNSSGTNNFGFIDYDGDGNFEIGSGGSGAGSVPLVFKTNGSERMRVLAGGGLTFNGDTGAVNALDDYEEGTHTCTAQNSVTLNSSIDQISYTKIGRMVTVGGQIQVSNSNSNSELELSLPFACKGNAEGDGLYTGSLRLYNADIPTGAVYCICQTEPGQARIVFRGVRDNNQTLNLAATTNGYYMFQLTYPVA